MQALLQQNKKFFCCSVKHWVESAPQPPQYQAISDNRSKEQRICTQPAKRSRQSGLFPVQNEYHSLSVHSQNLQSNSKSSSTIHLLLHRLIKCVRTQTHWLHIYRSQFHWLWTWRGRVDCCIGMVSQSRRIRSCRLSLVSQRWRENLVTSRYTSKRSVQFSGASTATSTRRSATATAPWTMRIASINDAGHRKNESERRQLECGGVFKLSTRVMVHPVSNPLHISPGKAGDICTLGHKSPDQNIGSFIGTTLIGAVWMRIVDLCSGLQSKQQCFHLHKELPSEDVQDCYIQQQHIRVR